MSQPRQFTESQLTKHFLDSDYSEVLVRFRRIKNEICNTTAVNGYGCDRDNYIIEKITTTKTGHENYGYVEETVQTKMKHLHRRQDKGRMVEFGATTQRYGLDKGCQCNENDLKGYEMPVLTSLHPVSKREESNLISTQQKDRDIYFVDEYEKNLSDESMPSLPPTPPESLASNLSELKKSKLSCPHYYKEACLVSESQQDDIHENPGICSINSKYPASNSSQAIRDHQPKQPQSNMKSSQTEENELFVVLEPVSRFASSASSRNSKLNLPSAPATHNEYLANFATPYNCVDPSEQSNWQVKQENELITNTAASTYQTEEKNTENKSNSKQTTNKFGARALDVTLASHFRDCFKEQMPRSNIIENITTPTYKNEDRKSNLGQRSKSLSNKRLPNGPSALNFEGCSREPYWQKIQRSEGSDEKSRHHSSNSKQNRCKSRAQSPKDKDRTRTCYNQKIKPLLKSTKSIENKTKPTFKSQCRTTDKNNHLYRDENRKNSTCPKEDSRNTTETLLESICLTDDRNRSAAQSSKGKDQKNYCAKQKRMPSSKCDKEIKNRTEVVRSNDEKAVCATRNPKKPICAKEHIQSSKEPFSKNKCLADEKYRSLNRYSKDKLRTSTTCIQKRDSSSKMAIYCENETELSFEVECGINDQKAFQIGAQNLKSSTCLNEGTQKIIETSYECLTDNKKKSSTGYHSPQTEECSQNSTNSILAPISPTVLNNTTSTSRKSITFTTNKHLSSKSSQVKDNARRVLRDTFAKSDLAVQTSACLYNSSSDDSMTDSSNKYTDETTEPFSGLKSVSIFVQTSEQLQYCSTSKTDEARISNTENLEYGKLLPKTVDRSTLSRQSTEGYIKDNKSKSQDTERKASTKSAISTPISKYLFNSDDDICKAGPVFGISQNVFDKNKSEHALPIEIVCNVDVEEPSYSHALSLRNPTSTVENIQNTSEACFGSKYLNDGTDTSRAPHSKDKDQTSSCSKLKKTISSQFAEEIKNSIGEAEIFTRCAPKNLLRPNENLYGRPRNTLQDFPINQNITRHMKERLIGHNLCHNHEKSQRKKKDRTTLFENSCSSSITSDGRSSSSHDEEIIQVIASKGEVSYKKIEQMARNRNSVSQAYTDAPQREEPTKYKSAPWQSYESIDNKRLDELIVPENFDRELVLSEPQKKQDKEANTKVKQGKGAAHKVTTTEPSIQDSSDEQKDFNEVPKHLQIKAGKYKTQDKQDEIGTEHCTEYKKSRAISNTVCSSPSRTKQITPETKISAQINMRLSKSFAAVSTYLGEVVNKIKSYSDIKKTFASKMQPKQNDMVTLDADFVFHNHAELCIPRNFDQEITFEALEGRATTRRECGQQTSNDMPDDSICIPTHFDQEISLNTENTNISTKDIHQEHSLRVRSLTTSKSISRNAVERKGLQSLH